MNEFPTTLNGQGGRLPSVLLVDDELDDLFITERRLKNAGVPNRIYTVEDGEAAIRFLVERIADHDVPCIVLADIRMPRLTGLEFLAWIREQQALKELPVVILTGSDDPRDKRRASELGVMAYAVKHPTAEELVSFVRWACKRMGKPA